LIIFAGLSGLISTAKLSLIPYSLLTSVIRRLPAGSFRASCGV
jgi:hypothetical protein